MAQLSWVTDLFQEIKKLKHQSQTNQYSSLNKIGLASPNLTEEDLMAQNIRKMQKFQFKFWITIFLPLFMTLR